MIQVGEPPFPGVFLGYLTSWGVRVGLGFLLTLGLALGVSGAAPRNWAMPGPAPRSYPAPPAGGGRVTSEGCVACHQEIGREWGESLHRRAWDDPYFARAYRDEPIPFCQKCHAPDEPLDHAPGQGKTEGVSCLSCHQVPEGILAGPSANTGHRSPAAHPVLRDPRLATPAACGGCHQFDFPGPKGAPPVPMQDTLGEHARSSQSQVPCQNCHMPRVISQGRSHRSHRFAVQSDPSLLRKAVRVSEVRLGRNGALTMRLEPGAVGHAFPTGDLYRSVEVRAWAAQRPRGSPPDAVAILARTYASVLVDHRPARRVVQDTRLAPPGPGAGRTLSLELPPGTQRARWSLVWRRSPPQVNQGLGIREGEGEVTVTQGEARAGAEPLVLPPG